MANARPSLDPPVPAGAVIGIHPAYPSVGKGQEEFAGEYPQDWCLMLDTSP
jgi:hypothetical protein